MTIHLNKKSGTPVYNRRQSPPKNYTNLEDNDMMNLVSSDEELDKQRIYTMRTKASANFNNESNDKKHVFSSKDFISNVQTENAARKIVYHAVNRPVILSKNKLSSKKFVWPYGGKTVFLTGTFDDWQASIQMTPVSTTNIQSNLFYATVAGLDFTKDIQYKFVVDGEWCYDMKRDHITDESGNINNIIYAVNTSS